MSQNIMAYSKMNKYVSLSFRTSSFICINIKEVFHNKNKSVDFSKLPPKVLTPKYSNILFL